MLGFQHLAGGVNVGVGTDELAGAIGAGELCQVRHVSLRGDGQAVCSGGLFDDFGYQLIGHGAPDHGLFQVPAGLGLDVVHAPGGALLGQLVHHQAGVLADVDLSGVRAGWQAIRGRPDVGQQLVSDRHLDLLPVLLPPVLDQLRQAPSRLLRRSGFQGGLLGQGDLLLGIGGVAVAVGELRVQPVHGAGNVGPAGGGVVDGVQVHPGDLVDRLIPTGHPRRSGDPQGCGDLLHHLRVVGLRSGHVHPVQGAPVQR